MALPAGNDVHVTFAERDNFVVGRSEIAHFRLSAKDQYFSRHHFLVEVNPPNCRLRTRDRWREEACTAAILDRA